MSELIRHGFETLLNVHGSGWRYGEKEFQAICSFGGDYGIAEIEGSGDTRTLRLFSEDMPILAREGEKVVSLSDGKAHYIRRSRRIDEIFTEVEISG